MRIIISVILSVLISCIVQAQDIIIKLNGDEIKSKIIEITSETIKYKEFDFQNGPLRNIEISKVFMIKYENGKIEKFNTSENEKSKNSSNDDPINDETQGGGLTKNEKERKEILTSQYKGEYFILGIGYMSELCFGVRAQWRWGTTQGWGFNIGYAYDFKKYSFWTLETTEIGWFQSGLKYYPHKNLYFCGAIRAHIYKSPSDFNWYSNNFDYKYNYDFFPTFYFGNDFNWGKKVGFGFNAGLGLQYAITSHDFNVYVELGFLIRL